MMAEIEGLGKSASPSINPPPTLLGAPSPNRLVRTIVDGLPRPITEIAYAFDKEVKRCMKLAEVDITNIYVYGSQYDVTLVSSYPQLDQKRLFVSIAGPGAWPRPGYLYISPFPVTILFPQLNIRLLPFGLPKNPGVWKKDGIEWPD